MSAATLMKVMKGARLFTNIFSPFYAPLWAVVWLLFFSTMRSFSLKYRLVLLMIIVVFTIIVPRLTIYVLRKSGNFSRWQFDARTNRHMQYAISLISYVACYLLLLRMDVFGFVACVIVASILAQIICFIINIWWKISVHMVGVGGWIGFVAAFSFRFGFDPVLPTCIVLAIAGVLGSCQMLFRQHSLVQIIVGFFVGMICARLTFMVM
jgi:hypothetical protein